MREIKSEKEPPKKRIRNLRSKRKHEKEKTAKNRKKSKSQNRAREQKSKRVMLSLVSPFFESLARNITNCPFSL